MAAEFVEQVAAGCQPIEQMIGLDAARRAMPDVALERDYDAGPIQARGNFRSRQPDDSAMPAVTGNHGCMCLKFAIRPAFEFLNGAIEDFALRFHPFTIADVEVLSQAPRFFLVDGIE